MGIVDTIKGLVPFGNKDVAEKVKALIIGGTKRIAMLDVNTQHGSFSLGEKESKTTYLVEPDAIYFFEGKPMLFYIAGISSPLKFDSINKADFALKSKELSAFMDSKAVEQLLTANSEASLGWEQYIPYATLGGVVIILLQMFGVLHIGG